MKTVVIKIILFAICAALVVGVVIPLAGQVKGTGQKTYDMVKDMNSNIGEEGT